MTLHTIVLLMFVPLPYKGINFFNTESFGFLLSEVQLHCIQELLQ